MTEDRSQMTEVRRQMTDDGRQKTEDPSSLCELRRGTQMTEGMAIRKLEFFEVGSRNGAFDKSKILNSPIPQFLNSSIPQSLNS